MAECPFRAAWSVAGLETPFFTLVLTLAVWRFAIERERADAVPVSARAPALAGKRGQKVQNLQILGRPAIRRTEIFIRADNSNDWYHQGPILRGHVSRTCHFGGDKAKAGTGFHVMAMTTDTPVPNQGGKPTKPLPKERTRSNQSRVIRVSCRRVVPVNAAA